MMKTIKLVLSALTILIVSSCNSEIYKEIKALENAQIFYISNDKKTIILDGVINSTSLDKFKVLVHEYPNIKKINIQNCDGSINDKVNLKLAKYIYENKYDIHLLENGLIASGGTDLFLAGQKRTQGNNTKIGVHSWAGSNKTALDFPMGHKNHLPYINYYISIGFTQQQAEDFYYFTINAAPADSIHWMTDAEIKKYHLIAQ